MKKLEPKCYPEITGTWCNSYKSDSRDIRSTRIEYSDGNSTNKVERGRGRIPNKLNRRNDLFEFQNNKILSNPVSKHNI